MRIAHIVRPEFVENNPNLKLIQDVTLKSFQVAKEYVSSGIADIEQYIAVFGEETIPFLVSKNHALSLDRSSLDIQGSPITLKLALMADTLDKIVEISNADYIIYSDIAIALQSDFYARVIKIIETGIDSFAIHNRIINNKYNSIEQFPSMLKARTLKQNDSDCIVYKSDYQSKLLLGNSCIGLKWTNKLLISSLMAKNDNFRFIDYYKLTFKLDIESGRLIDDNTSEFNRYNEIELLSTLNHLLNNFDVSNRNKLFDIYKEHLYKYYLSETKKTTKGLQYQIDETITKLNSPTYNLTLSPENIYHTEFRSDGDWSGFDNLILRQDPVFVLGYPRSGTTIVQSLLATQKNTSTLHETHFFSVIEQHIETSNGRILPDHLDELINNIRERVSLSVNAEQHIKEIVSTIGLSKKMLFEIIIIDNLLRQNKPQEIQSKRWIEKTPDHALFIENITAYYPQAKFIYVVRHPEKAIISRKKHFIWNNENTWPIEKHIDRWLDSIKAAEYYSYKYPGSLMFVKMEDIVKDPESIIRNICKFLNIPFNKSCLSNYKEISKVTTYSWEKWKNDESGKIYVDKVERRSDHLPVLDRLVLNRELSKYLAKFDYSIEFNDLHSESLVKSEFANCILMNYDNSKQLMDLAKINRQIIDLDAKHAREKEKVISELKVNLEKEIRGLQNKDLQIEQLQINVKKINKEILKKIGNIYNLNNAIKERVQEKEKLAEILEDRTKALQETKSTVTECDQRIKMLLISEKSKIALIQEQNKSIEVKDAKLSELLNSIENGNIEIEKLTKAIEESEKEILNLNEKNIFKESELKSLDIKYKKAEKSNNDLSSSFKKLEQKLTTKVIEIKKLNKSIIKLETLIKKNKTEYNKELLGAKYEMQEQISDHEIRIANLRNEKEKLKKDLLMNNELIDTIIASRSWKIGRIITKPVRLIKESINK